MQARTLSSQNASFRMALNIKLNSVGGETQPRLMAFETGKDLEYSPLSWTLATLLKIWT